LVTGCSSDTDACNWVSMPTMWHIQLSQQTAPEVDTNIDTKLTLNLTAMNKLQGEKHSKMQQVCAMMPLPDSAATTARVFMLVCYCQSNQC